MYAIGRVSHVGQQDFSGESGVKHARDDVAAVALAKDLVAPGGRIFLLDVDTGAGSEVSG